MNLRPSGYEPDELPDCSTPHRQGTHTTNMPVRLQPGFTDTFWPDSGLRFALQHAVHGHPPVAGISGIPVRNAGIGVDPKVIETLVQVPDSLVLGVASREVRPVWQGSAAAVRKDDFTAAGPFAAEAALVYQAMMLAAQLDEVVEAGLPALAPVNDVVSVHEMLKCAAREPATIVAKA